MPELKRSKHRKDFYEIYDDDNVYCGILQKLSKGRVIMTLTAPVWRIRRLINSDIFDNF